MKPMIEPKQAAACGATEPRSGARAVFFYTSPGSTIGKGCPECANCSRDGNGFLRCNVISGWSRDPFVGFGQGMCPFFRKHQNMCPLHPEETHTPRRCNHCSPTPNSSGDPCSPAPAAAGNPDTFVDNIFLVLLIMLLCALGVIVYLLTH